MIDTGQIPAESPLLSDALQKQVSDVFAKLTDDMVIKAVVDLNEKKGAELAAFLKVIVSLSSHMELELYAPEEGAQLEFSTLYLPATGFYKGGKYAGIAFHGVPGGKEINSFVLAAYNLAGPGQPVDRGTLKRIQKLDKKANIKVCVSLACHHCPLVVTASQHIAALNDKIEAEMIDANLYPELVSQYKIERVPFIIVDDSSTFAGEKSMDELARLLKK